MKSNNAVQAPAAPIVQETGDNAPKVTVLNDKLKTALAAMLAATTEIVTAEHHLALQAEKVKGKAWDTVRGAFLSVFEGRDPKEAAEDAAVLLEAYKADGAKVGGAVQSRASVYAGNLSRAVKLARKGKAVPEALRTCSLKDWLDSPVWREEEVMSSRGRKPNPPAGPAKPAPAAKDGEGDPANAAAAAAVTAAAEKLDTDLAEVMALVKHLHGPFRKQALKAVQEVLRSHIAKQEAAEGGSR